MSAPGTAAARRGPVAAFRGRVQDGVRAALSPLVGLLYGLGLRADHATVLGLVLSGLTGYAFFDGHFRLAAALLLGAGLCDILDGALARRAGSVSRFGAFMDSTLDRLGESLVLFGLAAFYLRNLIGLVLDPATVVSQMSLGLDPETWARLAGLCMLALIGSFMVSYTRARAEGLGLDGRAGWFERPERIVLLILAGALKVFWAMSVALILLTVMSFATALQRMVHVHRQTRGAGRDQ